MKPILLFLCLSVQLFPLSIPENCTAFLSKKDMLFAKNRMVQGNNCEQKISIARKGRELLFRITVPANRFESGNSRRNSIIEEILGETITFTFLLHPDMLQKPDFLAAGQIQIRNISYPLVFKVTGKDGSYQGMYTGKLTDLGITPPTAGPFHAVAKTHDYVILGFHIRQNIIREKM